VDAFCNYFVTFDKDEKLKNVFAHKNSLLNTWSFPAQFDPRLECFLATLCF
jgi:hypothetical protein